VRASLAYSIALIVTIGENTDSVLISKYLYDHKVSGKLADKAMSSYEDLSGKVVYFIDSQIIMIQERVNPKQIKLFPYN
jgi:hypothetical protein